MFWPWKFSKHNDHYSALFHKESTWSELFDFSCMFVVELRTHFANAKTCQGYRNVPLPTVARIFSTQGISLERMHRCLGSVARTWVSTFIPIHRGVLAHMFSWKPCVTTILSTHSTSSNLKRIIYTVNMESKMYPTYSAWFFYACHSKR